MQISTEFGLKIKSKSLIRASILTGNCLLLFSAVGQGHSLIKPQFDPESWEEKSLFSSLSFPKNTVFAGNLFQLPFLLTVLISSVITAAAVWRAVCATRHKILRSYMTLLAGRVFLLVALI